jgi:hypothetical protein
MAAGVFDTYEAPAQLRYTLALSAGSRLSFLVPTRCESIYGGRWPDQDGRGPPSSDSPVEKRQESPAGQPTAVQQCTHSEIYLRRELWQDIEPSPRVEDARGISGGMLLRAGSVGLCLPRSRSKPAALTSA